MTIQTRNLSLDIFRGLTICFMIIVNTAGADCSYAPLEHAPWHGFTPTDLVFPSFLFAVGNSIFFSKMHWNINPYGKILKRTAIIFLIGYFMYWFPFLKHTDAGLVFKPFHNTRFMGVLQRIALCYGIGSILIYNFNKKALWIIGACLLLAYWAMMAMGGDYSMLGNLAHKIDFAILGDSHMYHGEGVAFEPEGFLSTIPSIVNVIAGYLTASYMIENNGVNKDKLMKLAIAGFILLALSWLWNIVFPINKKIWTSSFVLQTVGWDLIILSIVSYISDVSGQAKLLEFFRIAGRNPLFLYLLSEVLVIMLGFIRIGGKSLFSIIYSNTFAALPCKLGSFLFAFTYMLVCWSAGWWLNKKGWVFKV